MTEITITRLGRQGDGIAEGPVYAPLTLPGEVVAGEMEGQILRNPRILAPSPDRVSPPCRHFKSCGGCQLQHASVQFVTAWKQDVVRTALAAQGLETGFLSTHVSQARRRAALSARRTKKGTMAGFHARASDVIVEIPDCRLLHRDLMAALPVAEGLAHAGASRKRPLSVRATLSESGLDILALGGKPLDGPLRVALAALADRYDLARLTWQDETVVTRRPPEHRFGTARVVPPPGAFLQATAQAEAQMQKDVERIVKGAHRVLDLFAGCGTFALDLARAHEVHAVEGDSAMMTALDQGWRGGEALRAVTHETRDLFRNPLIGADLAGFDAAVIDPPRAGASAQIDALGSSRIPVIAYVSCNPVSFARDARRLSDAGYALNGLRVIDQFRWSTHVELVAEFTR